MICLSSVAATRPFFFLVLLLLTAVCISWMQRRRQRGGDWGELGAVQSLTLLLILVFSGSAAAVWFLVEAFLREDVSYALAAVGIGGVLMLTGSRLKRPGGSASKLRGKRD